MATGERLGRRLRLGIVGGGPARFVGRIHRAAATMDERFELVAGVFSADAERSRAYATSIGIAPDRAYANFAAMAAGEAARADRIDVVTVATPNALHFEPARAFIEAGIHVLCEKPMTTRLEDARALLQAVRRRGVQFAVAHTYSAYPMIRQARDMVAAGELGRLNMIQVEYPQDRLAGPVAPEGSADSGDSWRSSRSRVMGCLDAIGSHTYNLAAYATGQDPHQVAAELTAFSPDRTIEDNVHVLTRYASGARGLFWASQVATGIENGLQLRLFGEKAGLTWHQEQPNHLWYLPFGRPPQLITRGGPGVGAAAQRGTRTPAGHPEGFVEAFANIYSDLADRVEAAILGLPLPDPLYPTAEQGARTVAFAAAVRDSHARGGAWVDCPPID